MECVLHNSNSMHEIIIILIKENLTTIAPKLVRWLHSQVIMPLSVKTTEQPSTVQSPLPPGMGLHSDIT